MTLRPTALVGAAIVVAVLTSTQVQARTKNTFTNRSCLDAPTRALLNNLEARFGTVALVKVCVPGARMPSGHVSWHARNKAFDFRVPKRVDQRDVMMWLTKNSPGVTISYRGKLAGIIHTDTGDFRKVIYRAASHEAGLRAVAVWQERERKAIEVAARPRQPDRVPPPLREPAPWTVTVDYVEPDFEEIAIQPAPVVDIFRRYFETKDVIVRPHVTLAGVDNRLVLLVSDAATHFGKTAYINSGFRSPSYNRRVGGARNSEHMKGRAVDFRVAGVSPIDLKHWILRNLQRWAIRGIGTYRTHLHADVRQATKLVAWNGVKKRKTRVMYAKRKPMRYAAAG